MDRPIRTEDDLLAIFHESCSDNQLLGVESEKFGVVRASFAPIRYAGSGATIETIFGQLCARFGWSPLSENPGAPVIALERVGRHGRTAQITLEPGAQLELSGEALADVHLVEAELDEHLAEVTAACEGLDVAWLGVGFHPLARQDELPWVPKDRYAVMREYFPTRGARGLDMMRRTATVQVNLDFASEADAMRKLRIGMKLAPIVTAMFANSPLVEGARTGRVCERASVWLDADPDRTGLLPQLWREDATFRDYAGWALDVPMYLFKREGKVFGNTGQTFRSFWRDGFEGERPTTYDWKMHLATLFPEVRVKTTIEMRGVDSQPRGTYPALAALWAGLIYDERALEQAEQLVAPLSHAELVQARTAVARHALAANVGSLPVRALAEQVLDIARAGLVRRARLDASGRDESRHLTELATLTNRGWSPAERILAELGGEPSREAIVAATGMLR
ncbi:MAG: glutamate--cysteine ligase [Deltaproteobacteria bacterium]|nr:glutamate--cysteine ligase [Deltaproteobacteria bacterium]